MTPPLSNVVQLYTMHCFFTFVSRMWDIGITLLVAELTGNSLFIVALTGLLSTANVFVFASSIGSWFDQNNRLVCMQYALVVKIISVTIGYSICAQMLSNTPQIEEVMSGYEIYSIPFFSAIASLSFSMVSMTVEKDWVIVLSGGNSEWLSSTNSIMTQIDMGCNALAPVVAGILFSLVPYSKVAIILAILNAASTLFLYVFLHRLYMSWPALASKTLGNSTHPNIAEEVLAEGSSSPPPSPSQISAKGGYPGTSTPTLFGSGCVGTMVAYSCLYFTVLSFGSLMMIYLKWAGLDDHWIGLGRGGAALSGFVGAALFPLAQRHYGLVRSGKIAIWYQFTLVLIAALGVIFAPKRQGCVIMVIAVVSCVSPPSSIHLPAP
jgi:solute carrier family 40 (iron-regulated transporter), member 1